MSELDDTLLAAAAAKASDPAETATVRGRRTPRPLLGLPPGMQLGHFRIERLLGAGGMGEVHLATDLALDRPVAIKVLPEELARDPGRRDRMVREARAQAKVSHPNVGHIYFIGEDRGRLYFAMEYVAGKTLADRIEEGPLAVDAALSVIRSAVLGLREAQRNGVTHRDVKPSNLMVDSHGVVKVLDFGLAAGEPGTMGEGPVAQTSLAGTPLYMAPEQARGEPVDFRTDIYALGATLYHLVSGTPPFRSDSVEELLTLHAGAPRPTLVRKGQSRTSIAAIDGLVAKMMAPNPADRFASYDELLHAIETASVAHTRPAGFWTRSIATGFDFLLAALLAVLIVIPIGLLLKLGDVDADWDADWLVSIVALVGFPAAWVRWGRTPAKALFELEVVDVKTGGRPSWRAALIRSLTMLGVPVVISSVVFTVEVLGYQSATFVTDDLAFATWVALGALALTHAALRVPGKRAPWDRWSGTMVRYRTTRATPL